MKFKEIVQKVDKSKRNEEYVDIEAIGEQFGLYSISYFEEQDRLKAYYMSKWCCTDTLVGIILYFLDDEFVFYTYQPARKSNIEYFFASEESLKKVKEYVISFFEETEEHHFILNENELEVELGLGHEITYVSELIGRKLICKVTKDVVDVIFKQHIEKCIVVRYSNGSEVTVYEPLHNFLVPWNTVE